MMKTKHLLLAVAVGLALSNPGLRKNRAQRCPAELPTRFRRPSGTRRRKRGSPRLCQPTRIPP